MDRRDSVGIGGVGLRRNCDLFFFILGRRGRFRVVGAVGICGFGKVKKLLEVGRRAAYGTTTARNNYFWDDSPKTGGREEPLSLFLCLCLSIISQKERKMRETSREGKGEGSVSLSLSVSPSGRSGTLFWGRWGGGKASRPELMRHSGAVAITGRVHATMFLG